MCGLKLDVIRRFVDTELSHPSRGVWIEIAVFTAKSYFLPRSHPSRGVWIEINLLKKRRHARRSHTPHGVCGLKSSSKSLGRRCNKSHPSRGVWIEIQEKPQKLGRSGHTTHGVCGLKFGARDPPPQPAPRHTPHGVCGLKCPFA